MEKLLLHLLTSYVCDASHPTVWRSPRQMSAIDAINNITTSNCQQLLAGHQWNALFPLTTEKKGVFVELSSLNWQGLLQPFDTGLAASHNGRHINLQMSSGKLKCQRFSQQPPGPCQRNNWSVHLLSPAKYSSGRTKTGRQCAQKRWKSIFCLCVCCVEGKKNVSSVILPATWLLRLWLIRLNQSRMCLKAGHVPQFSEAKWMHPLWQCILIRPRQSDKLIKYLNNGKYAFSPALNEWDSHLFGNSLEKTAPLSNFKNSSSQNQVLIILYYCFLYLWSIYEITVRLFWFDLFRFLGDDARRDGVLMT